MKVDSKKHRSIEELNVTVSGFRPEYFSQLAALEAGNFWFIARNQLIIWALKNYCGNFSSLLEIGCGTGFVMSGIKACFPEVELVGSELFEEGIEHARQRVTGVEFIQMDARKIPYRDKVDVIGAFDVLEHIDQDEAVLLEASLALKKNGYLVLTVPQHKWLWSPTDEYACHERRYTANELHRKVKSAGFEIIRSTSFVSFLLPAIMLSRISQRNKALDEINPLAEFQIPRTLNNILLSILRFEISLIKHGLSFPVGGSRLLIAKKT